VAGVPPTNSARDLARLPGGEIRDYCFAAISAKARLKISGLGEDVFTNRDAIRRQSLAMTGKPGRVSGNPISTSGAMTSTFGTRAGWMRHLNY